MSVKNGIIKHVVKTNIKYLLIFNMVFILLMFSVSCIHHLSVYFDITQHLTMRIVRDVRPDRDFIKYIGGREFAEKVESDLNNPIFDEIIEAIHKENCGNIFIIQSEKDPAGGVLNERRLRDINISASLGEFQMEFYPALGDGIIFLPYNFIYNEATIEEVSERFIILYHELSHILKGLRYPEKVDAFDEGIEAIRQIGIQNSQKALKLEEIFYGLDNLDLVCFQLESGPTDITQAELYTRYKLSTYENEPIPEEDVSAEIYFIKGYLETVMPFELAIPKVGESLQRKFQETYEENLAKLKEIYSTYVDVEALIDNYITRLKKVIITQGAYLMPDRIESILSSLVG